MRTSLTALFILTTFAVNAQQESCIPAAPIAFDGKSFFDSFRMVANGEVPIQPPELPLIQSRVSFTPPRPDPTVPSKQLTDLVIELTVNADDLVAKWSALVDRGAYEEGCSSRRAHSFRTAIAAGGRLHADYHIKDVRRECHDFFGPQKNDLTTTEIDVWQELRFEITPDRRKITLALDGHATDNVPEVVKFIVKALGNILALEPVSSLVFHLDEAIFAALKQERDALEMLSRYQVVATRGAKPERLGELGCLDLVYQSARFDRSGGTTLVVLEMISSPEHPISTGQACTIVEELEQQKLQLAAIGINGSDYTVKRGDSAWRIAEQVYGDGRYFPVIAAANNLTLRQADKLEPGVVLRLEPIAKLRSRPDLLILESGDSLWSVAHARVQGISDAELLKTNKGGVRHADRVYPLQALHLPDGAQKISAPQPCGQQP
jgi:hypothetical protein